MFPYTLFYVEDDLDIQHVFSNLLSKYFANVVCFSDGLEAKKAINTLEFDVLITAVSIPNISGLELARYVKTKKHLVPIVMFSYFENFDILTQAIDIGVDGYIRKSISKEKFLAKILKIAQKLTLLKKSSYHEDLLFQYKDAIDRSAIVSKTDINGIITYVNEAFCSICGYSEKELLGKPHSIVRHPDIPSSEYKKMWATIKNKQPWYGILKNRKKDGSSYYVKSHINPILNENGEIKEYIAIRNDITELERYKENLELKLDNSAKEMIETQKEIIYAMGTIGEKRSLETGLHVKRVANYSYLLAKLFGMSEKDAELIKLASPMHDIGKIGIPDSVLNKPGPLDDDEWQIIKQHPTIGYDMLKHSKREILQTGAIISLQHHERYDGLGYPQGLRGENIHIFGRISTVVDVYDALGNDRVYKSKWSLEQIVEFFEKERGKQFDPTLIDLFLENLQEFEDMKADLVEHFSDHSLTCKEY